MRGYLGVKGLSTCLFTVSTLSLLLILAPSPASLQAQEPSSNSLQAATPVVPQLIRYSGVSANRAGETVEAKFSVYAEQRGGEPLWSETQRIQVGTDGKFSVLLGAATEGGLPQAVFSAGQGQWLAVSIERADEAGEAARVKLASVAYAMKAADAETLAGLPVEQFVTQRQLAATAAALTAQASRKILPDTTPSGSGTANYLAYWTGAATLGNSALYQWGTPTTPLIGINSTTPEATLDVNGAEIVRGTLIMVPAGTATASGATNSPMLAFGASSFDSATSKPITISYGWQVVGLGNNTATPYAKLNLMYVYGSAAAKWTGISINPQGQIVFAPGQTFPGTGTITGVTAGTGLTGGGTSGAVSLAVNPAALETTFNSVYAGLSSANNLFTGSATFGGPVGVQTTGPGTSAITGGSASGSGVVGNSVAPDVGASGVLGYVTSSLSPNYTSVSNAGTAGVWGDASGAPNGADWGAGVVGTAGSSVGYGGFFYNNSSSSTNFTGKPGVLAGNAGSGPGLSAVSEGGGIGVQGTSNGAGTGVEGDSVTPAPGQAGVFGYTGTGQSSLYSFLASTPGGNGVAGMWGDSTGNPTSSYWSAGVVGTSAGNDAYGGVFLAENTTGGIINENNIAVFAQNYRASTQPAGTGGNGVLASTLSPAPGNAGVLGYAYKTSIMYDNVTYTGPVGFVAGVWGDAGEVNDGTGTYEAGIVGTGDDITAAVFENNSPSGHPTVSAINNHSGGPTGLFKTLFAASPEGACGFGGAGDLTCTGQVKALASSADGTHRVETYSVQSPENWMEDFGSGEMERGVAVVSIDRAFAETVSADASYHVFITPNGDSKGLYVTRKTPNSFEVRESGGGTSSLSFDYRIVAKRRGYEAQRLVDVTDRFNAEKAMAMPPVREGGLRHQMSQLSSPGHASPGARDSHPAPVHGFRDDPFATKGAHHPRAQSKPISVHEAAAK